MSTPSSVQAYTAGFGTSTIAAPIISTVNPGTTFSPIWKLGQEWINTAANTVYILTNAITVAGITTPTWTLLESGSSSFLTLTGDSGTATPSAGNVKIAGTASQITTAASGSTVTLSLPSAITAPGSLTTTTTLTGGTGITATTGNIAATTGNVTAGAAMSATTTVTGGTGVVATTGNVSAMAGQVNAATSMTATLGNITATNGNVVLSTAGNKLVIATGANASVGTSAAMSGSPGAVTVATTACSATAKVFYSRATTGGTPGQLSITAQDGTGFTLTSTGNETSTFNWWIINA